VTIRDPSLRGQQSPWSEGQKPEDGTCSMPAIRQMRRLVNPLMSLELHWCQLWAQKYPVLLRLHGASGYGTAGFILLDPLGLAVLSCGMRRPSGIRRQTVFRRPGWRKCLRLNETQCLGVPTCLRGANTDGGKSCQVSNIKLLTVGRVQASYVGVKDGWELALSALDKK